ncbi:MAG: hypothetical protein JWO36_7326 [Myxococcales bacterium]|nr:hypothetical protein [Myxococcales bacterium]
MRFSWLAIIAVGCGTAARPQPMPPQVVPVVQQGAAKPARMDLPVGESPMSIVVVGRALVWTDSTGALWTMAKDGSGTPKQLSDQHLGFAFSLVVAGDHVFASTKKDLLEIDLAAPAVTHAGIRGLADQPEAVVADDRFVYCTMFKRNEVMKIPARGGDPQKLFEIPRGVLGISGTMLFAASYSTGTVVTVPTSGGTPHVIARGIPRPTAIVADETYAFVYSERDKTLRRISLATGETTTIADKLENSDHMVADGGSIYTFSWGKPAKLLRIAKDGTRPPVIIADDLASPYHIAIDAEAIYVTSRDQNKIVRFEKAALAR